ncbi:MAG: hypothetical protein JRZ94_06345, partial [Nitrososphaerota archaeon]|nr:hypothetical protein [Nitrososphaerota archaeon]
MAFPNFPGIPPLQNPGPAAIALIASAGITKLLDAIAPKWGVYAMLVAEPIIVPDNIMSVDYVNASNIMNYPVEEGSFASYNKIQNPKAYSVVMTKGGSESSRTSFIRKLEELQDSLELYAIVTPERNYTNVNIDRVEYRRESRNGAGIIIAHVHFVEVRQVEANFSKPSQASPTNSPPS